MKKRFAKIMKNNKFFDELKKYNVNCRTAATAYDIFKKHPDLMQMTDKEIYEAYSYWYKDYYKICTIDEKDNHKIIEIVKEAIKCNLPENSSLSSCWEDKDVELYNDKNEICSTIKINDEASYTNLLEAYNKMNVEPIKISLMGPICPKCNTEMNRNGYHVYCYNCGTSIPFMELIKRGKLMTKKEMINFYGKKQLEI